MTKGSHLLLMLSAISALSNNIIAASPLLDLEIDENNPLLSRNLSSGERRHRLFKEGKLKRTRTKDKVVVADVKKDKVDLAAAAIAAYKRTEGIESDENGQHGGTDGINSDSGQRDQSGSSKDDGQHFSNESIDGKGKIQLESEYELQEKVSPSPLEEGGVTTTKKVVIASRLEDGQTTATADNSASDNEEETEESKEIHNVVEKERKNDAGSSIGFSRDGHDTSPDHDGDENSSTTAHDNEGEEDHDDHDSFEGDYEHTEDHDDEEEDGELDCEEAEPILHRGLRHAHKGHHSTTKGGKSAKHSKSESGKSSKTAVVVSAKSAKNVPSANVHVPKHEPEHNHKDAKSGKSSKTAIVANAVNSSPSAKSANHAEAKSAKSTTVYRPPTVIVDIASAKSVKTTAPVVAKSVKSAKFIKSAKSAKAKRPKAKKPKGGKAQVKCTPKPTTKPTEESMPNISSAPVSDGGTSTPNPTESPIEGGEMTKSPTSDTDLSDAPTTQSPTKLATSSPSSSPVGTLPTSETPTKAPTPDPTPESTLPPVAATTSSPTKLTASPVVSTASPTLKPVDAMSLPTKSPVDGTSSPTPSPVDDTASPTLKPVDVTSLPTKSSVDGTASPTDVSTSTSSPTNLPTASPVAGTPSPTLKPVDVTSLPTKSSVDGTASPTDVSTSTSSPTNLPTASPVAGTPSPTLKPLDVTSLPTKSSVDGTASPTDVSTSTSSPTNLPTASPVAGTPSPTLKPLDSINTSQPTDGSVASLAPSTAAPTSIPDRALYYNGFEQGFNLTLEPWWTSDSNAPWERTSEEAASGVFSIRSPDLRNEELTPGESNVTFTTDPSWDAGALHFSAFPAVDEPFDRLTIFVDGEPRGDGGFTENPDGFEEGKLNLSPGEHQITFRYQFNPNELNTFPPQSAERIGTIFLDDIYFVPAGITAPTQASDPTTIAPTSTPDDAVYYDGFEQGTFPESDDEWSTKGDLPWELTTQEVNSGVFSIRSPQLPGALRTGESNVTFSTNPAWGRGSIHYSVYSAVQAPHDDFRIFVDDILRGQGPNTVNTTGFEEQELQLPPGTKEVTFAYRWNPFDLDSLPPAQPGWIDAVFLDDVYFVPS